MLFSYTLAAGALLALANGTALKGRATSGEATFYGGNVDGGMCSFSGYTIPSGLYGLALTDSSWDGAKSCGACIEVTGPKGNKITAMVVDQCPGCGPGHLDLFPDAFAQLDDPSKGIIQTTWQYVDCPISSPIQVRNKEGVSPYWFSLQVRNANKRVESLEFSTDGGASWTATARQPYNYFEKSSGSGTSSVDVRITSVDGDVVIIKGVGISSGSSATASANFGSASSPPPAKPATTTTKAAVAVASPPAAPPSAPSTTQPAPVVASPTSAAVFQESPAAYGPKPTTFVTSTTKAAAAVPSSSPLPSPKPTPSKSSKAAAEPTVTVTVDACGP